MLSRSSSAKVWLAVGSTDLRKSIDGLAITVQMQFKLDPFNDGIFVFCNRACDKLKILYWYNNGFWLYYRRLERGRFKWPTSTGNADTVCISERELSWLLEGLDIHERGGHKAVKQRKLI